MGEKSTTPVYIGRYENGRVVFEPIGELEATDMDIEAVHSDDVFPPMQYVRTITRDKTITVQGFLSLNGLRGFYKAIGMPAYLRTEYLFPKKKKRGTARRKRKMKAYEQRFIKFIHDKYGSGLIGTNVTHTIIDEYIISKDELPAFAGPFEGEEN